MIKGLWRYVRSLMGIHARECMAARDADDMAGARCEECGAADRCRISEEGSCEIAQKRIDQVSND